MTKVFVVNGSPRTEKGNTARILAPFIEGMTGAGADVDLVYAARIEIKPCTGESHCWYRAPGQCYIRDEMQELYPRLHKADILVLATPVYIPLPGEMQNLINRLMPLVEPRIETREGRTRVRFREDIHIGKIALVSTGGWWERDNAGTVVRIAQELAENTGVPLVGPVLRPHVSVMRRDGELTADGEAVCAALRQAGDQLVREGVIAESTLEAIARPLVSREDYQRRLNAMLDQANRRAGGG